LAATDPECLPGPIAAADRMLIADAVRL